MDGAAVKERRSATVIESLRDQLLPVRFDVKNYRQRLSLYTKRFTADVADSSIGLLYSLGTEVKTLVESQRKDNEHFAKTDVKPLISFCIVFIVKSAGLVRLHSVFDHIYCLLSCIFCFEFNY